MTKKSIFSLILLAVITLLSIVAFIFSKSLIGDVSTSGIETKGDEEINIRELIITETKDGQKFWEVYADSGNYNNGTDIAVLSNIVGNFYKDGNVILSVASPVATYNNGQKEIILKGGANAATNKDVFIKAEEICWKGSHDKLTAKGNVKIIKNEELMTISDESSFNTDFTNLELSGNSNAYVYSIK